MQNNFQYLRLLQVPSYAKRISSVSKQKGWLTGETQFCKFLNFRNHILIWKQKYIHIWTRDQLFNHFPNDSIVSMVLGTDQKVFSLGSILNRKNHFFWKRSFFYVWNIGDQIASIVFWYIQRSVLFRKQVCVDQFDLDFPLSKDIR